jgi:FkbM family methyltransferase
MTGAMQRAADARHIRLRSPYTLGDVVVLTAAVRDLHRAHPRAFRISVETSAREIWENNPHVAEAGPLDRVIDLGGVTLDRSGATGRHYVHAYLDLINRRLGTSARITEIKGDIHLSRRELRWHSDVWTLCGREIPFWLISCGGKLDIPLKWWDAKQAQQVVDALRGRIQFVQVGNWGCEHPRLEGAIDLRGKTNLRDLIHLMHYADGALCGVTSLMHLAAAVPTEHGGARAAVIVGGAREPASWEAYPGHEHIGTEDRVPCGHCWRSKLADCEDVREGIPLCLREISSEEIVGRIERLAASGRARMLSARDRRAAGRARLRAAAQNDFDRHNLHELNAAAKAAEFIAQIPPLPPRRFAGRGIVICAGGARYFACAWVCIRILRHLGCELPIELWHLGREEVDLAMEELLRPFGVRCVNARRFMRRHPMRNPLGWELKAYAMLHSRFREILYLDADNVPVRDPAFLFDSPEFRAAGAIFWPDYRMLSPRRQIWKLCGVPHRREPEFESGQMVVDKERCWRALNLAWWYNDHSEFFYRHIHGDKETFHMAWRRLEQPYTMPAHPVRALKGTMCQHDFAGRVLFQHRSASKWKLFGASEKIDGFEHEAICLRFLAELRERWNGHVSGRAPLEQRGLRTFRQNACDAAVWASVVDRNEYRLPRRFRPEDVIVDIGAHIGSFSWACHLRGSRKIFAFEPDAENFALARRNLRGLPGVKLEPAAVLDRDCAVESDGYPEDEAGINTGGATIRPLAAWESGGRGRAQVRAHSIDGLLRQHGRVKLVKLDCEGSEWPIVLGAREWGRVDAVCGEYHLGTQVQSRFGNGKTLAPELLLETLARSFPEVSVEPPRGGLLGRFWAARRKHLFARAIGRSQSAAKP